MKPRLIITLALLVLAPLAAVAWFGARASAGDRSRDEARFEALLAARLDNAAGRFGLMVEEREQRLERLAGDTATDSEALRQLVRTAPLVRQAFLLDAEGRLVHPPPAGPLSEAEQAFGRRTRSLWEAGESFYRASDGEGPAQISGWHSWYYDDGLNLIWWRRLEDGRVLGFEVSRVGLLAELIGELPAADAPGEFRLRDAAGRTVHRWGADVSEGNAPGVSRALDEPLGGWRIEYVPSAEERRAALGSGGAVGLVAGIAALALALVLLGVYFARESGREIREARQRVNFVNQVSHELKTPLTNIRMYAELIEEHADEEDEQLVRWAGVVAAESQRLSRLIGNVLSFARHQRSQLTVRRRPGSIDELVDGTLEQFGPRLEERGVRIERTGSAPGEARVDGDALGQIVGNLLSNVEKYGHAGGVARVRTARAGNLGVIEVSDEGPGIGATQAKAIFRPFYRASSAVTEGVSGTGIGLSIARELARLHGGDLTLEPSARGACFRVTLDVGQRGGER